jgi:hypothetical protein
MFGSLSPYRWNNPVRYNDPGLNQTRPVSSNWKRRNNMKFEVKHQDLALLYSKAKNAYKDCISNAGNEFLKNEVNVPLECIQLIEKDVKIVFYQYRADEYLLEVALILFAEDKEIGKYIYIENEIGQVVDDILVFY